ncbi:hypothetical protein OUZ56_026038 [Daphnia magna]|uniref:Uncharacterized protein n=1 Tax=Daphnia magna TaxID=35525 RepID=A0ABQ9ZKM9_9CRUS|nr:hypothetical protein OUZ56_026038 [Daphnia magna]
MPKRTNPRLPSCPRDPSRRLHPLRELSSVPVETSPTPASSLESGNSFVGEALNFEGPIPKDHLTEKADSQGESVETARGLDSDPKTEVDLRAATSPVVPVGILSSRKDKLWKLSENLLARQSSKKVRNNMRTNGWSALKKILPTTDGELVQLCKAPERVDGKSQTAIRYAIAAALPWPKEAVKKKKILKTIREIQETFEQVSSTGRNKNDGVKVPYLPRGRKLIFFSLINLRGSQKISTVGSPVLTKGDLSRVKREIGYLFAEMSHPLLGQRCDRGEEIIGEVRSKKDT